MEVPRVSEGTSAGQVPNGHQYLNRREVAWLGGLLFLYITGCYNKTEFTEEEGKNMEFL